MTLATYESHLGPSTRVCRAGGVHIQSWLSLSLGDRIVGDFSPSHLVFSEGVRSTTVCGNPNKLVLLFIKCLVGWVCLDEEQINHVSPLQANS